LFELPSKSGGLAQLVFLVSRIDFSWRARSAGSVFRCQSARARTLATSFCCSIFSFQLRLCHRGAASRRPLSLRSVFRSSLVRRRTRLRRFFSCSSVAAEICSRSRNVLASGSNSFFAWICSSCAGAQAGFDSHAGQISLPAVFLFVHVSSSLGQDQSQVFARTAAFLRSGFVAACQIGFPVVVQSPPVGPRYLPL
jgi:hypothetical protein